jgi:SAM-dependent methyltransferase
VIREPLPYTNADLYDVIYAPYTADIEFYVAAARSARGSVLELACGTGRVMIPCLEAGADVDGLDLRPEMLEALRRKAGAKGLAPRLVVGDMRDFTLPRRYALITIPFRAFLHLMTTDDQIRALRRIRDHLAPGGALLYNVFHPSFEHLIAPADAPMNAERQHPHPTTGLPVLQRTLAAHCDRVNQRLHIEKEVVIADARGGAPETHAHALDLRWVYKAEMELLLRSAGFTRWDVRGGFAGEPLERDDQEMVWTAWQD